MASKKDVELRSLVLKRETFSLNSSMGSWGDGYFHTVHLRRIHASPNTTLCGEKYDREDESFLQSDHTPSCEKCMGIAIENQWEVLAEENTANHHKLKIWTTINRYEYTDIRNKSTMNEVTRVSRNTMKRST